MPGATPSVPSGLFGIRAISMRLNLCCRFRSNSDQNSGFRYSFADMHNQVAVGGVTISGSCFKNFATCGATKSCPNRLVG
eukprot:15139335-Ditylum_brightwellii.AAC.1